MTPQSDLELVQRAQSKELAIGSKIVTSAADILLSLYTDSDEICGLHPRLCHCRYIG